MTLEEKLAKADEYLTSMTTTLEGAQSAIEQARGANEQDKVGCMREAITAMKGLLKLSEQNAASLRSAAGKRDLRAVDHEYVKLTIAYSKFGDLDGQVRGCGGAPAKGVAEGRPVVEGSADAGVPALAPDSGVQNFGVLLDRPPSASGPF
jgi:hypothetical protein